MTWEDLFPGRKAVIAMVHLKGSGPVDILERAQREIDIYYRHGVDAVLVENYFGSSQDCRRALKYLQEIYPDKVYGVNILGNTDEAFALADKYGAKFIQIDSVCGHLAPKWEVPFVRHLQELRLSSNALVFGGVRFKYQPELSGRTVEEDLALGQTRCDAVVVAGAGTGIETPEDKIRQFRSALGTFPLITGAGVTLDNLEDTMALCDGVIVGSWLKKKHNAYEEVKESYVRDFMTVANRCQ